MRIRTALTGAAGLAVVAVLSGQLAHFGGGRWTVQNPPRYAGKGVVVIDLAQIPGTRSVLAVGTSGPPLRASKGHPAGVILEHRP